ncbi:MAG: Cell cycle protein [Pedosphaera sp.]|nr:Cell cycle protein [Pedosphaera sp.]
MKTATTILVFCVASLLALGMVMLYSSSMADKGTHYLFMQLIWCSAGLVTCGAAAALDYKLLKKFAWPLFGLAVAMLVLVLIPHIGFKVNGARRWFKVGGSGIRFQPSELGKLALIVAVAWYGDRYQRQMGTWKRGILFPAIFIGLILGLIFVEPDRGTTILMAAVSGMMLLIAGVRLRCTIPPILAGIAALGVSLMHDTMRMNRIFSWMHQEDTKEGVGYQANHAMMALGAGGWTGLGLGNSREKLGFLPEHNTDFIFSIIGEELGLVATLLVVLTFIFLVCSGLYISYRASDTFGLLLGSGITSLIGLQAVINIGVVTSALPNKGLPLPFISYGGSNLLMMLTCVGLLLSIARRARVPAASADASLEPEGMPSPQMS